MLGGVDILEDLDCALRCAGYYKVVCGMLNIPAVFKASYDKANRSSIHSFHGPGLYEELQNLETINDTSGIPVITNVHSSEKTVTAAKGADIIQLQASWLVPDHTGLARAIANKETMIDSNKKQFLIPKQRRNSRDKLHDCENEQLLHCERGTHFGYDNIVVCMLGIRNMKRTVDNIPLIFDVTHVLPCRDPGGWRIQVWHKLAAMNLKLYISINRGRFSSRSKPLIGW